MGPAHPEHEVGVALHSLQVGQTVQVKGPFGSFRYQPGKYKAIGERCDSPSCKALQVMSAHESLQKHLHDGRQHTVAHASGSAQLCTPAGAERMKPDGLGLSRIYAAVLPGQQTLPW